MNNDSANQKQFQSPLQFLTRWDDAQCGDWLLEGLVNGHLDGLEFSRRLHPYTSSYLYELFLDSYVAHQNILRRGVVRAVKLWQKHHGIDLLQELIFLVIYTRALDAVGELKRYFLSIEDVDAETLYKLRGDILYSMRSLTSLGDEASHQFFLRLYRNPVDYRFIKQIVLGLVESRPNNTSAILLCNYIDRFFFYALQNPIFFDDFLIEDFSLALADTLDAVELFDILQISKQNKQSLAWQIGVYVLTNPESALSVKYTTESTYEVTKKDGATLPVPNWYPRSTLDEDIQRKSAYNESMIYIENTIGILYEQLFENTH